jgi:small subunit ribosomal protein S35
MGCHYSTTLFRLTMLSLLGVSSRIAWAPLSVSGSFPALLTQARFKRSKKRKMKHRVINEVKRETMGLPPGPSLGSIIGNPETPYQIAKTIKQHVARLTATDTTHIRRKKDFGKYNFHRMMRMTGMAYNDESDTVTPEFVTGLTQLQDQATLPPSAFVDRFPFPHTVHYKAFWGPPTVETEPNRYSGSMVGVGVSFRVSDLLLRETERQQLLDIVGSERYDESTDVVSIEADVFPDRNHNAAFLGDMVQYLLRSVREPS